VAALSEGIVPAGEDAQTILYESELLEEGDLMAALREVSGRYEAADFDLDRLPAHIEHDIRLLRRILRLVEPITAARDAKLQVLQNRLRAAPLKDGKCLIFTQYADTARYLYENLNPEGSRDDVDVIFSGDKSKARVVGRFAPKANPEYRSQYGGAELSTLVATDVLSEGLNLQDCNTIVNYDLHWNPVRLIQRFGRIDRIGSDHDTVHGFNFLPETGLDQNLGLCQRLHNRIQEIHDTIGEDAAVLDGTEQLNEEALYAIYEMRGDQLGLFEDETAGADADVSIDLNEAEEILRQLRKENPAEYERIANLRDGIRTGKPSNRKGLYVFCQAGRYQKLYLLDDGGSVVSTDLPRVLGTIRCTPEAVPAALPDGYNEAVTKVKRRFADEVSHRQAERKHTLSLTHPQRYALRELRLLFGTTADDGLRRQINIVEQAFRLPVTAAVNRELTLLRRHGVSGEELFRNLVRLYHQHNLREWHEHCRSRPEPQPIPVIVCSEALG
jgi:superfamily II DNA/RNA helicase